MSVIAYAWLIVLALLDFLGTVAVAKVKSEPTAWFYWKIVSSLYTFPSEPFKNVS